MLVLTKNLTQHVLKYVINTLFINKIYTYYIFYKYFPIIYIKIILQIFGKKLIIAINNKKFLNIA